jgi:hypothetical protein
MIGAEQGSEAVLREETWQVTRWRTAHRLLRELNRSCPRPADPGDRVQLAPWIVAKLSRCVRWVNVSAYPLSYMT